VCRRLLLLLTTEAGRQRIAYVSSLPTNHPGRRSAAYQVSVAILTELQYGVVSTAFQEIIDEGNVKEPAGGLGAAVYPQKFPR